MQDIIFPLSVIQIQKNLCSISAVIVCFIRVEFIRHSNVLKKKKKRIELIQFKAFFLFHNATSIVIRNANILEPFTCLCDIVMDFVALFNHQTVEQTLWSYTFFYSLFCHCLFVISVPYLYIGICI